MSIRNARWMMFVDGENWSIQGREHARGAGVEIPEGPLHIPDVFLWRHRSRPRDAGLFPASVRAELEPIGARSYFYTTVTNEPTTEHIDEVRGVIRRAGFEPRVFKKERREKRRAVDISLAVDMLGHAHNDHFDVAVLLAGDGDYVPLVEQVKRLGKRVWVAFFDDVAHQEMKLVPDLYLTLTDWLINEWREHLARSAQ